MAAHGRDPEDDIWEDASDIYEVRSEAGDSETEDQSVPDDDVESSEVQIVAQLPGVIELNSQEELRILGTNVVLNAIQPLTREAQ